LQKQYTNLKKIKLLPILLLCCLISCNGNENGPETSDTKNCLVIKSEIITDSYIGNGVQWGGYDILNAWTGNPTLSDSDWNKLFERVSYMRPPLVRIMVADGWNYIVDNKYNPSKSEPVLLKILDFCQKQGITVLLGEWGHKGGRDIDETWLENSSEFLRWLIVTKGYSCIRYFNMVNEPNGNWSSIDGNYSLWTNLLTKFHDKLVEKGIDSKIKLTGPDIAVWKTDLLSWVRNTKADIGNIVETYDIHTYPKESEVRDGSYKDMIEAYKKAAPASSDMLMTELGFKYGSLTTLGIENSQRISKNNYSSDDSNMFVYDAFYGIDMADAIIQNMLAGYAGVIIWNLDDAMYNKDASSSTLLKRWGFWNILGAEKFENEADENIRPWFYPMSLISRYFPAGSKIHDVTLPDKVGLRAVAGEKNGRYSIAIVNSNTVSYTINLSMENGVLLADMKMFKYISGKYSSFEGKLDENGFAKADTTGVSINLTGNNMMQLQVPARSFSLITNMN
jgi:hypothetical protein